MLLSPMRYKEYIWPHNPTVYSIVYERQLAVHKVPFGRYCTQDLGLGCRVMRGEGAFAGPGAYEEFKRLASVFYREGPGLLVHPLWQTSNAYFTSLQLEQEPTPDYVRYSFSFTERFDGYQDSLRELKRGGTSGAEKETAKHTIAAGETLWGIAAQYKVPLRDLLSANPWIKNANLIHPGDKVVIPC